MELSCDLCPRRCGAARSDEAPAGVCRSPLLPRIARAAAHFGEEPCICGSGGAGAIFFTGCNLRCVFCQNREISRGEGGQSVSVPRLREIMLRLRDEGHTVIFSTHNMSSVEEVCDEIALINHSSVVLAGHVDEVKSRFRTGLYEAVSTDGSLASAQDLFDIVEHTEAAGLHTYVLHKAERLSNSALITAVAERVELRAISEKMPTMQEIFLKVVSQA